jgi:predicted HTH domain antitoxin
MEAVGRTAEEVNQKHGTGSWRPIELFMEDNFPRSVAAYKNFDVLLVNAVRDGMNLVAKESAVINEKNGVLVLSENAGAHEELGEHALTVNPYDVDEQADAIHEALTMPDEERERRAREALALELYREGKISLRRMGELAGVGGDYWAADRLRAQHQVPLNYSVDELEADRQSARRLSER